MMDGHEAHSGQCLGCVDGQELGPWDECVVCGRTGPCLERWRHDPRREYDSGRRFPD